MNSTSRGPIWFGIALVVIVMGIGAWIYFLQPPGGLNLSVTLTTSPENVLVGDPFTLSVMLSNDSGSAMQNAAITLVLPNSIVSVDTPDQRVVTQSIGAVDANGVSHEDFHLIATNPQDTVFHFTAKVTYNTNGSSAQFENDGVLNLAVGQPAVSLNISAPSNVFSGQTFPITVTYNNNSDHAITGMSLAMQYPPAFTFGHANSALTTNGNNSWDLGTIPANGSGTVAIAGDLIGPNDASYPIAATLSENIAGQNYVIGNPSTNVALAESPLSFSITANGTSSYVTSPGNALNYVLTFTNHSSVAFQNLIITANLVGGMFNFSSLQSEGYFNSLTNTVTWNGASAPQLLVLEPGQSGSVNFEIQAKSSFPIRLLSDKNYSLAVNAKLVSPTVPPGTTASSTISVAGITTKFGGNIVLAAQGYYHDPESAATLGFAVNKGPYPPRVNQATQYTIHWLLTNYATDADNVNISAYLQSGTTCTGKMLAPASTTFTCNPSNGQVNWQVPFVAATTGITGKPLEAVFQVMNTPAVNQVGQDVTLIGPATLTATDAFTGSAMQSAAQALTTALPNDTSITTNQRQVTN